MKTMVRSRWTLALAAFVAAALFAPVASAQGDWVDPTGRFSLRVMENGLRVSTALPPLNGDVLSLEADRTDGGFPPLVCKVNERPTRAANAVQELANREMRALDEAGIEQIVGGDISNLEHRDTNGMAVVAYDQLLAGFETKWRVFFLVNNDAVLSVTIMCGVRPPSHADDTMRIASFLDSLEFLPQAAP